MGLSPSDFLIDDDNEAVIRDYLFRYSPDGSVRSRGAIPRDFKVQPESYNGDRPDFPNIPRSEWSDRIKERERQKATGLDLMSKMQNGQMFDAYDQNGDGYCWFYSFGSSITLKRAQRNMRHVRLNPHSGAAIIKKGRDEGGWCGLSVQFGEEVGIAEEGTGPGQWPLHSRNLSNDNPTTRASMAKYRCTEAWFDLTRQAWDRNMTFDQVFSLLLSGEFPQLDFNWWGHSVCGLDPVEVEPGSFGIRILNSWAKSWGDRGTGVLRGDKAFPNGAVCPRDVVISNAA